MKTAKPPTIHRPSRAFQKTFTHTKPQNRSFLFGQRNHTKGKGAGNILRAMKIKSGKHGKPAKPQNLRFLIGQRNPTKGTGNIWKWIEINLGKHGKPQNISFLVKQRNQAKVPGNILKSTNTNPGKPPKPQNPSFLIRQRSHSKQIGNIQKKRNQSWQAWQVSQASKPELSTRTAKSPEMRWKVFKIN